MENVFLVNKKTNICENIAVFESLQDAKEMLDKHFIVTEVQEGVGIGDTFKDGVWSKKETPIEPTTQQQREEEYETMLYKEDGNALILWEGEPITVDTANKKWLDYSAEGSEVANELSALIISAKAYIRELYPDND